MKSSYVPSLNPKEANVAISQLGIKKSNTKPWQLLLLGILAGLYIGFGGHLFLVTLAAKMGKVMGGFMFSTGLILVVIAGAELFTGNVTLVVGVVSGVIPKRKMLTNWVTVYFGNFIGAFGFAWFIAQSGLLGPPELLNSLGALSVKVAEAKLAIPFGQAIIRGTFCNMLVILAIIMAIMAKDIVSKIACIVFPITCFVASGFEHCVANMYLIPLGLMAKGVPVGDTAVMFANIIPVTLGNLIGGIVILLIHPNRINQLQALLKKER